MVTALPSLRLPPIGFAHRGARAHAPENTLAAFQLALRLGATGLESDVWVTADGVAVLDHDGVLRRWGRRRGIATVVRADLPAHVPTLAELYETCGTAFELSLDLKDPAAFAAVLAVAREAGEGAEARLWLCHHELDVLGRWRASTDEAHLVDSTRKRKVPEGLERRAARLEELGVDALNMHHSDWSGGSTTLLHRFGRLALAWDLQHAHDLLGVLRMGIDGVYSDHVDRMVDALIGY